MTDPIIHYVLVTILSSAGDLHPCLDPQKYNEKNKRTKKKKCDISVPFHKKQFFPSMAFFSTFGHPNTTAKTTVRTSNTTQSYNYTQSEGKRTQSEIQAPVTYICVCS